MPSSDNNSHPSNGVAVNNPLFKKILEYTPVFIEYWSFLSSNFDDRCFLMCFCSYPCVQDDDDLVYEEDVNRNPYIMKGWIRYLDYKKEAPNYVRNILYERALRELPGSYKIWIAYLKERKLQVRGRPITDPSYEAVNKCFERCLVYLHKVIHLHHSVLFPLLSSFIAAICFLFDYCTLILTIFFFFFVRYRCLESGWNMGSF